MFSSKEYWKVKRKVNLKLRGTELNQGRPVYSYITPPLAGGGIKSKDLEMGKEIKGWKNEKMKNIEDFTLLTVLKCNIKLLQHYFKLFKPKYYYVGGKWGRKSKGGKLKRWKI